MKMIKLFMPLISLCFLFSYQANAQYKQSYGTPASVASMASGNIALYKPTKQSSSFESSCACVAVDGNINGNWWNHEITATNGDNGAWWEVDLLQPYDISAITVYNRTDAVPERLRDFYIKVSDKPFRTNNDGDQFAYQKAAVGGEATFTNRKRGRYIRIYLNRADILSLAEVIVKGTLPEEDALPDDINLALGKATRQASNFDKCFSNRANDGNTKGNYHTGEITHTANTEANEWWEVDLGAMYKIKTIKIFNRTDAYSERLEKFDIYVSPQPLEEMSSRQIIPFASEERSLQNVPSRIYNKMENGKDIGRYIRIQLQGKNHLQLAEVQVFGDPVGTIAVNGKEEDYELIEVIKKVHYSSGQGQISYDATIEITKGYEYEKTLQNRDMFSWNLSVSVESDLDALLGESSITVEAGVGGEHEVTKINTERESMEKSTTATKVYTTDIPGNGVTYVFNRISGQRIPLTYTVKGKGDAGFNFLTSPTTTETGFMVLTYPIGSNMPMVNGKELDTGFISSGELDRIRREYEQNFANANPGAGDTAGSGPSPSTGVTPGSGVTPSTGTTPSAGVNTNTTNLALGKQAKQSSTFSRHTANFAVDGNTNDRHTGAGNAYTTTKNDQNSWWEVDLGANYTINQINIFNVTDKYGARLKDLNIKVSQTPFTKNEDGVVFASKVYPSPKGTYTGNVTGRYVRVYVDRKEYLNLCEVQVMGTPVNNTNSGINTNTSLAEVIVSKVLFGSGSFDQKNGSTSWVECDLNGNARFNYQETKRDGSVVYLHDSSRKVNIALDTSTMKIKYSDANNPTYRNLFDIIEVQ